MRLDAREPVCARRHHQRRRHRHGGGLPELAGEVFLGPDGVGGQGVLPIPIAYEGWVERAVAAGAPFTAELTSCQRRPILYVTRPDQCRPGD